MGGRKCLCAWFIAASVLTSTGCGQTSRVDDRHAEEGPPATPTVDQRDNGVAVGVVRGRWEIPIQQANGSQRLNVDSKALLQGASRTKPISGTVAAQVTFTLIDTNFVTPPATGIASYGRLDISELRDNSLRVCGTNGTTRCTKAGLRVYSSGTPQKGLWNSIDSYGAPIVTGAQEVGLDVAGSAVLQTITLGTQGIVKLTDFSTTGTVQIPISVNFTDAPSGSYASTLVVEYYLL